MYRTHRDFQSVFHKNITNSNDIYEKVKEALDYQNIFERATFPSENHLWKNDDLSRVRVTLEKLDRLYLMRSDYNYNIMCRMDYYMENEKKWTKIYLQMMCWIKEDWVKGFIFVSFDPKLLLEVTLGTNQDEEFKKKRHIPIIYGRRYQY